MAKATQLPSGSWRVQVYIDGKYKSITRPTKREAERAALELQLKLKRELAQVTVGQAIDDYIESKDGVLSPSTISGYKRIRKYYLQGLMDMPIDKLDESIVQKAFNDQAKTYSQYGKPVSQKTLANIRGLFSAALKVHGLSFSPVIPAKQKKMVDILTPQQILPVIKGTNVELPCLLAMCLSLSISEIRGLTVDDIKDGCVIVRQSIVDVDGKPVQKDSVKAYERSRKIPMPLYVQSLVNKTEAMQNGTGHLVPLTSHAVYDRFRKLLKKAGLPHMTFHELRHLNASIMLALGIPDKYAMERGGWKTTHTMKNVYQHTFSSERIAVDKKLTEYFDELLN